MTEWQPMPTAPKDGTEVLTWNGRRRHVAYFDKVESAWVSSYKTVTMRLLVLPAPTCWAELIDPPK